MQIFKTFIMATIIIGGLALAGSVAVAMSETPSQSAAEQADAANRAAQDDVKARATQAVPVPDITNFQARRNVSEFMQRLDERNKVWYVYERAPLTGEIIGRYTSSSYPQSVCTFMTPPEELKTTRGDYNQYGNEMTHVTTAIALDGVYYKGGDCPDFFFDYNTGATVVMDSDAVTIAVDQPLDVDVPDFSFRAQEKESYSE